MLSKINQLSHQLVGLARQQPLLAVVIGILCAIVLFFIGTVIYSFSTGFESFSQFLVQVIIGLMAIFWLLHSLWPDREK